MILELSKVRGAQDHIDRTYPAGGFAEADDEYKVEGPVRLSFDVDKDKDRYRLAGTVQAPLGVVCSRCVEPFALPVNAAFDLRYAPHTEHTGEADVPIEEDDLSVAFYEGESIDLRQLVREQFYLALPMKPLCSETCQGLCPTCGTNRNTGTCACDPKWEDPRLAALKALLNDKTER